MQKDLLLCSIVNSSELINSDGASNLLAGKLLGKPVFDRVTGIDLLSELLVNCENNGFTLYFLGEEKETIEILISPIREKSPKIDIAAEISATNATILFVGFSRP